MKSKYMILMIFLILTSLGTAQTIYKVPAKDVQGNIIPNKWVPMQPEQLERYLTLRTSVAVTVIDSAELSGGLKKHITIWTKNGKRYIETHIVDPKHVVAQEGYLPVDMIFLEVREVTIDSTDNP